MAIQDWKEVLVKSFEGLWSGTVNVLANLVGALIIFIIGLVVASGIRALIERLVTVIKLDRALAGLGLQEYFDRAGLKIDSAKFFGKLFYWFFVIVFLLAATDILGFSALSDFLRQVLLYIPNVIVAVLILLAAVLVGGFLKRLVTASIKSAKLNASNFLGSLTLWAVVVFGFFAALAQLGIAIGIIQSIVTGFIAMLAIAGGIAFGLGGKEYASHLIEKLRNHIEHR